MPDTPTPTPTPTQTTIDLILQVAGVVLPIVLPQTTAFTLLLKLAESQFPALYQVILVWLGNEALTDEQRAILAQAKARLRTVDYVEEAQKAAQA